MNLGLNAPASWGGRVHPAYRLAGRVVGCEAVPWRDRPLHPRPPSHHRGQALIETCVVMLALALLMVLVPILGKYQDISHQTLVASRYAAWQSTATNDIDGDGYADADDVRAEVHSRFFSDPQAPIRSGAAPEDNGNEIRVLWVDHSGKPLLAGYEDIHVSYGKSASLLPENGHTGVAETGDLVPMVAVQPDDYRLKDKGLYRGVVQVELAKIDDDWLGAFSELELTVTRQTNVLPGAWTASSPEQVRERVTADATLFPTEMVDFVLPAVQGLMWLLESGRDEVEAPKLGEAEFWDDMVPEDRLP